MTELTEIPLYVESPAGPLFVVESIPTGRTRGIAVLSGGGWLSTGSNRNAVVVRMARRVAEAGYRTARFDWRGTGESGGSLDKFDLKTPFTDDVGTVLRHLEAEQSGEVALTGICFGSVSALAAAQRHPEVGRLALISLPFPSRMSKADHKADRIDLDSVLRMAARPATWTTLFRNAGMRSAVVHALRRKILRSSTRGESTPTEATGFDTAAIIEQLAARGVSIELIFGEGDLEYASYNAYVEQTPLPASVAVTVVPGDLSNFGTIEAQDAAIDHVVAAITRT